MFILDLNLISNKTFLYCTFQNMSAINAVYIFFHSNWILDCDLKHPVYEWTCSLSVKNADLVLVIRLHFSKFTWVSFNLILFLVVKFVVHVITCLQTLILLLPSNCVFVCLCVSVCKKDVLSLSCHFHYRYPSQIKILFSFCNYM